MPTSEPTPEQCHALIDEDTCCGEPAAFVLLMPPVNFATFCAEHAERIRREALAQGSEGLTRFLVRIPPPCQHQPLRHPLRQLN